MPTFQNVTVYGNFITNPSFTCHNITGTDRLLIVTVAVNMNIPTVPTSVTYNGVTMGSPVVNQLSPVNGYLRYLSYVIVAPATGANVIAVTSDLAVYLITATSYTDVNQSTPTDTWATNTGQTTTATVDVSSAVGDTVFAAVAQNDNAIGTVGGSATERSSHNSGTDVYEKTSDDTGATTRTMSWTVTSGGVSEWIIMGVSLNPVISCIPNWQCELPLNGYENDGCGNRRLNSSCNPPIEITEAIAYDVGFIIKSLNILPYGSVYELNIFNSTGYNKTKQYSINLINSVIIDSWNNLGGIPSDGNLTFTLILSYGCSPLTCSLEVI